MKERCCVDGCDKPKRYSDGHCAGHYSQLKKHGKIIRPILGVFPKKLCTVVGCERERSTKLYCNAHYLQHKAHGKIVSVEIEDRKIQTACKIEGCNDPFYCKGYCVRHYGQTLKHGKIKYKKRLIGKRIGESKTGGYVYLLRPKHPQASKKGYVKRANIVWEENTGHVVIPPELIHHKNEIKNDDLFENLELCANKSVHMKIHKGNKSHQKK